MREGNYLYVDKTERIYDLILDGGPFFLSRPRRFGKSLLLSTIEAYFLGRRELFRGLALDRLTDDWEPHPVLHLDLNTGNYHNEASLVSKLDFELGRWEEVYGDEMKDRSAEERFAQVILNAYKSTGKKVVVLIDEYDKPLLSAVDRPELIDSYRTTLKAFYGNLKTMDQYIEFAMLTGVARFSKVSIFSDLNNVRDISFTIKYSDICGITATELRQMFQSGIVRLAKRYGVSPTEMEDILRLNYDGYHFSEVSEDIYNPFSLVNAFADNSIGSYWFGSSTPTSLVKLLQKEKWDLRRPVGLQDKEIDS